MAKVKKRPKVRKKTVESPSPLREIVGDDVYDVYDVWVAMLKGLVPDGRTHRLSVLVATMLAYASSIAWSSRDTDDEDAPAYPLLAASEGMEDEEASRLLKPMLTRLFKARMPRSSTSGSAVGASGTASSGRRPSSSAAGTITRGKDNL